MLNPQQAERSMHISPARHIYLNIKTSNPTLENLNPKEAERSIHVHGWALMAYVPKVIIHDSKA